jgi:ketosteroid isomerase-like protein
MSQTLEQRIQQLEDRQGLQEVITDYLIAVDALESVEDILNVFTEDAVFDMSGINYPSFAGKPALREFFTGVFAQMTHHAHYATNFKVDAIDGDTAKCRTHVIGMGKTLGGDNVLFYLQYHLGYRRTAQGWKIQSFRGKALMPL